MKVRSKRPTALGSHSRMIGSPRIHEQVAAVLPSGENATDRIVCVPGKVDSPAGGGLP